MKIYIIILGVNLKTISVWGKLQSTMFKIFWPWLCLGISATSAEGTQILNFIGNIRDKLLNTDPHQPFFMIPT